MGFSITRGSTVYPWVCGFLEALQLPPLTLRGAWILLLNYNFVLGEEVEGYTLPTVFPGWTIYSSRLSPKPIGSLDIDQRSAIQLVSQD